MRSLAFLTLAAAALLAPPAQAFQPESGIWLNPAESGRGMTLEVQDNILQFMGYLYNADGTATWYISAGPLVYTYNNQGVLQTVTYSGQLDGYSNGQCLTCTYRPPTIQPGLGGPVTINFRTEIEANLTWGGRTIPIERLSVVAGDRTARMQGEWQAVIDFSDRGNNSEWPYRDYPYFGEVLLIDGLDRTRTPNQFLGCRPASTEVRCDAVARRDHDAAGQYDATNGEYVITVKDIPGTSTSNEVFFTYFVNAGIDQFDGTVVIHRRNDDLTNLPAYLVRGFRSASKTYAQTGVGPAFADDDKASLSRTPTSLSALITGPDGKLPPGLSLDEAARRTGIDIRGLMRHLPELWDAMDKRAKPVSTVTPVATPGP